MAARVFLANMPINFNTRENLEPPLGISYLGAMLKKRGHDVFLKDYEVEDFSEQRLVQFIKDSNINIVGLSFRTASYRSAKAFVKALDKVRKDIIIIAGGHHATAFPGQTILDLPCDIVVRGEGEYAITELADAVRDKRPLSGIKGITYRYNGQIIANEDRPPITNLDELPFPERELLNYDNYTVATIITSRGCPFSCVYCDKGISTRQVQFRGFENVYKEISDLKKRHPEKRIYFVDDHFFLAKSRLYKLFNLLKSDRQQINWICQARVDGIDLEILQKAKEVGCKLIIYGIESGDPDELVYMKKQATVEQARQALLFTHQAGIKARVNFMLGFPISTHKTIRNTIRFAKTVPIDIVRFFSVAPLPNTELWDRVYGRDIDLNKIDWDKFDFYTPTYSTSELSPEDIMYYVAVAYINVLKKKVFWELSVTFLPRFFKLCCLIFEKKRIRGNISQSFPSTVNLLLDMKTVMHSKNFKEKIKFLRKAFRLEAELRKEEKDK